MNRITNSKFIGLVSILVVLSGWTFISHLKFVPYYFLPSPLEVMQAFYEMLTQGNLVNDILTSCYRVITGFIIATMLAIPFGIAMGLSKKVERLTEPLIGFIRYTPIPAFIPLFILWFGIGEVEKIVVIGASVFFQMVLMVANSVLKVPLELIQSAQTLGATNTQIVTKIIWPYIKPNIWDDMRINLGWAWSGLILSEIVGSTSGLGYVIIQSQRLLQTPNVIAAIIIIGLLGALGDAVFKKLYIYLFPWAPKLNSNAQS